jgi:primosomal protein N' (replication factor Y)
MTPSLESIYNVEQNKYTLLDLPERVVAENLPEISLVNLGQEAKVAPQLGVISRKLRDALQDCLANNEQALLFLNRRGYCPILACPSCNYVKRCEQCSISMTYHTKREILLCHLCGHSEKYSPPYRCPSCRQKLTLSGFGTQRIEKNIAYLFPRSRIARMDRDTTSRRGSHERILNAFGRGEIDILLGTQMIAKGLDFPNVTLVGVINADISLHVPDFRATETTFQLVTQVAGRSGRGNKPGKVIVQSFTPDHPAITCAVNGDWKTYSQDEMVGRKQLAYPPFTHLIYLLIKGKDESIVVLEAEEVCGRIGKAATTASKNGIYSAVLGPAPAALALSHGYHRWQIILKVTSVFKALEHIVSPVLAKYKPNKVHVIVDVDPL